MKSWNVCLAALGLAVSLVSTGVAHGAAALAAGAGTSAHATASDPAKRRMQVAADPMGITDFQFTLHYDPIILHVAEDFEQPLIRAINGYTLGVRGNPQAAAFAIDPVDGFVTVRGYWPASNGQVPMEEINVYDVQFQLNDEFVPGVPIPLETPFIIYSLGITGETGGFGNSDYMLAGSINLQTQQPILDRTYTAGDPANPILSNNSGLLMIGPIPEPSALALAAPAAALLLRRRRA